MYDMYGVSSTIVFLSRKSGKDSVTARLPIGATQYYVALRYWATRPFVQGEKCVEGSNYLQEHVRKTTALRLESQHGDRLRPINGAHRCTWGMILHHQLSRLFLS